MSFWRDQKALVTGCSGLIGGPLCRMLLEQGAAVVGVERNIWGTLPAHGIDGRFSIYPDLACLLEREPWDGVTVCLHMAAWSHVERSRANPLACLETNVMGTVKVLEGARLYAPAAVVLVPSSNHVYGQRDAWAEASFESDQLRQMDTYSVSKICADYIARAYAHNYRLKTVIARSTNCFGPYDPHEDHLVPSVIAAVLRGERPVIRGTGQTRKSYLYVDDVAEAFLLLTKWCARTGRGGEVFNISSAPISVLEVVRLILEIMGSKLEPVVLGQGSDQSDERLSTEKIEAVVGWVPRHSLQEALRLTVDGFRARLRVAT